MLTSLCLWSVVLSINTRFNKKQSKTLVDLAFVSSTNPLLGLSGMLAFFSLAGIPPLVGFFAKMEIFVSALGSSLFFAAIIAILSSVISSYYYIRLVKTIYFEKVTTHFFVFPIVSACSFIMSLSTFFFAILVYGSKPIAFIYPKNGFMPI
jgi:NADH-quinone oxidoreductase subunit N